MLQVVSELLGWPQDVTLRLDPKVFESKLFSYKHSCSHPSISKMLSPFPSLRSQMEVRCQTNLCQNEDGFPKLLRACTVCLGIRSQPEYDGREFVEHGPEKSVVTVYIGSSLHHVEWSVTTSGHRFKDTCQVVARKALRVLCQIYEEVARLDSFRPFRKIVQSGWPGCVHWKGSSCLRMTPQSCTSLHTCSPWMHSMISWLGTTVR